MALKANLFLEKINDDIKKTYYIKHILVNLLHHKIFTEIYTKYI